MNTHINTTLSFNRREFLKLGSNLMLSAITPSLSGCQPSTPLTIASHVWPGYEFMFLAKQMNQIYCQDFTLIESKSATDSLQKLADGQVMGAALTLDETLRGIYQGLPLSVVMIFDVSSGADAVIAKAPINSLENLKGARLGVETSALGALMLIKLLAAAQLNHADVNIVAVNVDGHYDAWRSNRIDALISYEPVTSVLENEGAIRLFDSKAIPNTIFDVLAVRSDVLGQYSNSLKCLIKAHFQAQWAWKSNPIDTNYRLAKLMQLDVQQVPGLFQHLELPDLIYNKHLLSQPAHDLHLVAKELLQLMEIPTELLSTDLFLANYLPETLL